MDQIKVEIELFDLLTNPFLSKMIHKCKDCFFVLSFKKSLDEVFTPESKGPLNIEIHVVI